MVEQRPIGLRFSAAVACIAVAILARWLLVPVLQDNLPFLTLFPAIAVTVWYAGVAPGVFAAILGYVLADRLFIAPLDQIGLIRFGNAAAFVGYFVSMGVVIAFGEMAHRARRIAERSAREAREQGGWFRTTLTSIGDAVITTDTEGNVTLLNPVAEQLTGWTMHEALGRPITSVLHIVNEDTRAPVENPAVRSLREGSIVGLANHTILISKDGIERPIDDSAAPILDPEGSVAGVVVVFREVTERRQLETLQRGMQGHLRQQVLERTATLRESEEMLRLLVEGTRGYAIHSLDAEGRVTSWNSGAQLMTGYDASEAIGQPLSFSYAPEDIRGNRPAQELDIARREGKYEGEGWRVRKDGTRFWATLLLTALRDQLGVPRGFSAVTRDETERKRAEADARRLLEEKSARREAERATAEIRTQREQLRVTLRSIGDAVITTDAAGVVTMINAVAEDLTGWTQDTAAGQSLTTVFDIRNEETGSAVDNPAVRVLRDGVTVGLANHTILVSRTGERHPIDDSAAPIRDANGHIAGVVLVFRDVTARRAAERSLRESEARKTAFLETATDGIVTMDHEGRIVEFNPGAQKMFGRTYDEMIGQSLADYLVPPEMRERHRAGLAHYLATGEGPILDRLIEMPALRADGTEFPVEMSITRLRLDGPPVFTAHLRDITERAKADRRRRARLAVTQILARATSLADAAPGILQAMGESLGWEAGALWVMDPRDRVLRCDSFWKEAGRRLPHFERATLEQAFVPGVGLPGRVWNASAPAWIPDVGRDPNFPRAAAAAKDELHSAFGFPIGHGAERFGVIEFVSVEIREPDPDLLEMVSTLGGQVGQFMERRRAEQMAYFLADASASLAALVDDESALQRMARLVVPAFADWCTVDLLGPENHLRRVAVAHVEPSKVEILRDLHRRLPPDPNSVTGVWQVLRSGRSELVTAITDDSLRARVVDEDAVRMIRELGLGSYMAVPLKVRGRTIGVITLIAAESGRRYDKADLAVAEDLAHCVVGVAMENARLYGELREADQRKDEFLAILSHELRNPLAPLRNALELIKRRGPDAPATDQAINTMERQLAQLMRLVDDLLDLRRITRSAPELRREPVDMATIIRNAVETSRPLIDDRGHQLTVALPDEPIPLDADATRLAQVFGNLLNNAAKYTDPGGRIWLSAARDGADAVVTVRDTGIGIPREMLGSIFEMFTQLDRSLERSGGLGVGLTLAKRLVDMHGGTMVARSEGVGRGSEFEVRLPISTTPRVAEAPPSAAELGGPSPRRRILVVDDNRDSATSLAMILDLMGNETQTAFDGPGGLEAAERFHPDVILLDLGLPGLNGYEVCRRIREHLWGRQIVIMAVTGWGQEQDKRRSKEAGFDFHLVKPVDSAQLEKLLHGLPSSRLSEVS